VIRRQGRTIERSIIATFLVASVAGFPTLASAQQVDSARTAARAPNAKPPAAKDAARPPLSPKRAFLYSLLAPGYGQSVMDRPIAGVMFAGAEMTWIAMATKAAADLRFARAHKQDSLIVSFALDTLGNVKVDTLGRLVGEKYAPNRYGPDRVAARRKHLEDYFALIVATHLLAGAEAFVSAQLWDLPAHVTIKQMPFGPALAATFRW
jgi:hypothetical protein